MIPIVSPFAQYFDLDGSPLDAGYLYFGRINQNPQTAPVVVYWDAAGTIPAAQPIRTLNGYPVRNGSPAVVYSASACSLYIKNRRGMLVAYTPNPTGGVAPYSPGNKLLNANFQINQDSVSGTVVLAPYAYGHDQWRGGASGATYSFSSDGVDTTVAIIAGSIQQPVEGRNIEGGSYTLSWDGTAQGSISGGSPAQSPVTVDSIAPGTTLTIEFTGGTVTRVELTAGAVQMPFQRQRPEIDLLLCRRYYRRIGRALQGIWVTSSVCRFKTELFPPMRQAPSFSVATNSFSVEDWSQATYPTTTGLMNLLNVNTVDFVDFNLQGWGPVATPLRQAYLTSDVVVLNSRI